MRHFIQYWKHYDSVRELGTPLTFSASSQFLRRGVSPKDTLWIVAIINRRLTLLGTLRVAKILDDVQAKRRFGDSVYQASTYAVPIKRTEVFITEIDIQELTEDLRFLGGTDRLPESDSNTVDGRRFQSIRELSPDSAKLLQAKYEEKLQGPVERAKQDVPWIEDIRTALVQLGGIATLREIYAKARELRPTVPESSIRRTIQMNSSDSSVWTGKEDVFYSANGIGKGVWGLRSLLVETPLAVDIHDPDIRGGRNVPHRVPTQTYRILRDTVLCREIKALYNHKCQICGVSIELADGRLYSEAHHIRPLGVPHNGADVASNILVVCPNHHAMLDYAAVGLSLLDLRIHEKHFISQSSIDYHNDVLCEK